MTVSQGPIDPAEAASRVAAALDERGTATLRFVRSAALFLENEQNPLPFRAARVRSWLKAADLVAASRKAASLLRVRVLGVLEAAAEVLP
jgi:hypothetical protein